MAGFDDLIPAAMPYLATETIRGTAGSDWQWDYEFEDDAGNLITINTGYTATAKLHSRNSSGVYTVVYTATVTFPTATSMRCSIAAATTTADTGNKYFHEVTLTRTSDSKKITVVGAGDSTFLVKKKES